MWTADVASTWNTSTLKKASSPEWQTCHVADGRTADCIIYTHLLPAAAFGRYTCSVRLSEMIYDGPFAYMKRIDYWGAFSPYLRVSLLSLWKVSYRPSDESRRSFVSRTLISTVGRIWQQDMIEIYSQGLWIL